MTEAGGRIPAISSDNLNPDTLGKSDIVWPRAPPGHCQNQCKHILWPRVGPGQFKGTAGSGVRIGGAGHLDMGCLTRVGSAFARLQIGAGRATSSPAKPRSGAEAGVRTYSTGRGDSWGRIRGYEAPIPADLGASDSSCIRLAPPRPRTPGPGAIARPPPHLLRDKCRAHPAAGLSFEYRGGGVGRHIWLCQQNRRLNTVSSRRRAGEERPGRAANCRLPVAGPRPRHIPIVHGSRHPRGHTAIPTPPRRTVTANLDGFTSHLNLHISLPPPPKDRRDPVKSSPPWFLLR